MHHVKLLFGMLASIMLIACQPAGDMAEEPAAAAPAAPAAQTAMPAAAPAAAPPEQSSTVTYSLINEPTWVNLFAGHDLSQFNEVGGPEWRIVDDYVEATSGEAGFLVTRGSYGNVQVQLEFWTSPDANSGIFMRCQDANQPGAATCYEVNIFDQRPDQSYRTGGIVDFAEPMAQMDAADRWNTFDIVMDGDHLVVHMNDTLMVDTTDDSFAVGPIGFQWSAGVVRFRNIRLRPL
ncbi:MAG: DUF1080 domain-containing protein [Gammaproteobacteria bacterium]|nr:DUF1080 domain-containing protein [Gammaproteobacteria bacterium]MDH3508246.1 DUF1080 domain-containing protein [Gammaproteobacteria bacterium]